MDATNFTVLLKNYEFNYKHFSISIRNLIRYAFQYRNFKRVSWFQRDFVRENDFRLGGKSSQWEDPARDFLIWTKFFVSFSLEFNSIQTKLTNLKSDEEIRSKFWSKNISKKTNRILQNSWKNELLCKAFRRNKKYKVIFSTKRLENSKKWTLIWITCRLLVKIKKQNF